MMCFMIWAAYGFGLRINYKSEAEIEAGGAHGLEAFMQSDRFIHLPLAPYAVVMATVMKQQSLRAVRICSVISIRAVFAPISFLTS